MAACRLALPCVAALLVLGTVLSIQTAAGRPPYVSLTPSWDPSSNMSCMAARLRMAPINKDDVRLYENILAKDWFKPDGLRNVTRKRLRNAGIPSGVDRRSIVKTFKGRAIEEVCADGPWDEGHPACAAAQCSGNGACSLNVQTTDVFYDCTCDTGYSGQHCELLPTGSDPGTDVFPTPDVMSLGCFPNPCANEGTCVELIPGSRRAMCLCLPDSDGDERCRTAIKPTAVRPTEPTPDVDADSESYPPGDSDTPGIGRVTPTSAVLYSSVLDMIQPCLGLGDIDVSTIYACVRNATAGFAADIIDDLLGLIPGIPSALDLSGLIDDVLSRLAPVKGETTAVDLGGLIDDVLSRLALAKSEMTATGSTARPASPASDLTQEGPISGSRTTQP